MHRMIVTGGAGFIGSAVIRHVITKYPEVSILNLDKLTYAGCLESLRSVDDSDRYQFVKADICDSATIRKVINKFQPDCIMHLAAESHVDRSISSPDAFIDTNIRGTYRLLEAARQYWESLDGEGRDSFRFHHVSTDEVFGDLQANAPAFSENNPYQPSSPYSASKAGSDHLVRAWHRTYGLPVVVSNCSNNYGPYQFPEKLIPVVISNALSGKPIPVYGDGQQIRDWLYVEDHAEALLSVAFKALVGETYNIGGNSEVTNIDLVKMLCAIIDELAPAKPNGVTRYDQLITFVDDRPGHDTRYAIDPSKINKELRWEPSEDLSSGLRKTAEWYLSNQDWISRMQRRLVRWQLDKG